MPNLPRAFLVFAAGLLILAIGGYAWYASQGPAVTGSGTALIGGPFELVDQNGHQRRDSDFTGRYRLIYFGYTFCPDICPATLLTMVEALDVLAEDDPELARKTVPIFITVDPERDTVAALKAYAPNFGPDLVALTGTPEQVAAAAKVYRVYYRKAESDSASDYLMDHSSFVFFMEPDGGYLTHFSHAASAEEMAAKLADSAGS